MLLAEHNNKAMEYYEDLEIVNGITYQSNESRKDIRDGKQAVAGYC